MSTYRETESDIREAVESILDQTFSEFEFIIINDDPTRLVIKEILDSYSDNRIRLYQNHSNIGLAMSMNMAAELAQTNIFARMDADDIAQPNRLEEQFKIISQGNYDFVFSDYDYIDEKSQIIENKHNNPYYTSDELNKVLARVNVIHHPTVMFTKAIFEKVGGYRNFPCSQDVDLWFRMNEADCRFYMIKEKLLHYRINPNSVSNKRWFQQQITCNYIYDLSIERLINNGKDSFSLDAYNKYLLKCGLGNSNKEYKLRKDYSLLHKASLLKKDGNKVNSFIVRMWVFLASSYMRRHIIQVKRKDLLLKLKSK